MSGRAMIVVAAGSSRRFGGDKTLAPVSGKPLIAHTLAAVTPYVDRCVLVCRPDQMRALRALGLPATLVPGGATRTASEMAGMAKLGNEPDLIGVHDGARPMVDGTLIEALFAAAERHGGAVPVLMSEDLLVTRDELAPLEGAGVAQTPQVFKRSVLVPAYARAKQVAFEGHDTVDVVMKFSDTIITAVPGDPANLKVTFPEDLEDVRSRLRSSSHSGQG